MRYVSVLTLGVLLLGAGCKSDSKTMAPGTDTLEGLLQKGQEEFKSGRYEEALRHYQAALQKQPDSAAVYNLMGMVYRFQHGKLRSQELKDKEIAAFQKASELDPKFVVALVNLGSSLYNQGRKPEAAEVLKRVLELVPNHPEADVIRRMAAEGEAAQPPAGEPGGDPKGGP